ncbi:MAG: ABC transporter substrate-binding protein [Bacteroidetes bacterium]|nr:ABC transporter substrate-binding protein [Bacteroidota bacterium]MCL5025154.1 ABC transporter substrate-binding protein [Chloroflexota bacterium]
MRVARYLGMTVIAAAAFLGACAPVPPGAPAAKAPAPSPATAAPAAPAAAAPTSTAPAVKPTPALAIKRGGTLRLAETRSAQHFDPQTVNVSTVAYHLLFDALVAFTQINDDPVTFDVTSELAESWDIKDPKTIVVRLRRDVKFSDGSVFNADVAKWNLDRLLNHPKSTGRGTLSRLGSVDRLDDYTIQLNLKSPSAAMMANLTFAGTNAWANHIVSKEAMEKLGEEEFSRHPVGSGPMTLANWEVDSKVELQRRDGYWRKGDDGQPLPYLDKFVDYTRRDTAVSMLELKSGALDIIVEVEPKDFKTIESDPNLKLFLHPSAAYGYFGYGLNPNIETFRDKRVRHAISYAIDREAMAKTLGFGYGKSAYVRRWGPGVLGYHEGSFPTFPYNPDKAKQLLAEAGRPDGIDATMTVINRSNDVREAELVKAMWDKVGIRVVIDVIERVAWGNRMQAMNFEIGTHRPATVAEPEWILQMETCNASGVSFGQCNKEFDDLLAQGAATYDTAERDRIYQKAINVIVDDAWTGVGYTLPFSWAMSKKVKNFKYQFTEIDPKYIWLDQ